MYTGQHDCGEYQPLTYCRRTSSLSCSDRSIGASSLACWSAIGELLVDGALLRIVRVFALAAAILGLAAILTWSAGEEAPMIEAVVQETSDDQGES